MCNLAERIEEPFVCFIVEKDNGLFLGERGWGKIPVEEAKRFFGIPSEVIEVIKKVSRSSSEDFCICRVIVYEGVSIEERLRLRPGGKFEITPENRW